MAGSIVLTGGKGANNVQFAQTHLMAVQTGMWRQKPFPALNVARHSHSSLGLGNKIFVACGYGEDDCLRSVEMLRLGAETWVLIDIPDLTPRVMPILSQIDS